MNYRFPLLHDTNWLTQQLKSKTLREIAVEINCSYSGVLYAVRVQKLIIPQKPRKHVENRSQIAKEAYKRKYPNGRFGEQASNWQGGKWKSKHLLGRYGITIEEKQVLFDKQQGKCWFFDVCGYTFRDVWEAATDHDHLTGKIRGLLCRKCNTWMAIVDNKKWLEKALSYQDIFS